MSAPQQAQPQQQQQQPAPSANETTFCNVYVARMPPSFSDAKLLTLCKRFGNVISARAMQHRGSGLCKGYGFVLFSSAQEAAGCIAGLNGATYEDVDGNGMRFPFTIEARYAHVEATDAQRIQDRPGIGGAALPPPPPPPSFSATVYPQSAPAGQPVFSTMQAQAPPQQQPIHMQPQQQVIYQSAPPPQQQVAPQYQLPTVITPQAQMLPLTPQQQAQEHMNSQGNLSTVSSGQPSTTNAALLPNPVAMTINQNQPAPIILSPPQQSSQHNQQSNSFSATQPQHIQQQQQQQQQVVYVVAPKGGVAPLQQQTSEGSFSGSQNPPTQGGNHSLQFLDNGSNSMQMSAAAPNQQNATKAPVAPLLMMPMTSQHPAPTAVGGVVPAGESSQHSGGELSFGARF